MKNDETFMVKVDPIIFDTKNSSESIEKRGLTSPFFMRIKATDKDNARKIIEAQNESEVNSKKHPGVHHFKILGVYTLEEYRRYLEKMNE